MEVEKQALSSFQLIFFFQQRGKRERKKKKGNNTYAEVDMWSLYDMRGRKIIEPASCTRNL